MGMSKHCQQRDRMITDLNSMKGVMYEFLATQERAHSDLLMADCELMVHYGAWADQQQRATRGANGNACLQVCRPLRQIRRLRLITGG